MGTWGPAPLGEGVRERGKGEMREMPQREKDWTETEKTERKSETRRKDKGAANRFIRVPNTRCSALVRKKS